MKLTLTLLIFCLVSMGASTYSQTARFDVMYNGSDIVELFKLLEEKSEFYFFYQKEDIANINNISVEAKNATIVEILDKVIKGTTLEYKVVDRYVIIRNIAEKNATVNQQPKIISGKVTDSSGAVLPGVTIVVKGTTTGIITDVDGRYSLANVPEDATLVFSFVGMKTQEISVVGKTKISVTMAEETVGIEEVVAVGYGTVKKKDLTGSVSSIKSDELQKTKTISFMEALEGKMAGVQVTSSSGAPGAAANITIRGNNSVNAGTQPLYVIDGVQIDLNTSEVANNSYTGVNTPKNPLAGINPSDIVSIEVLKDASATAIYGSRGANGVILITTKSGGTGKTDVEAQMYLGISNITKNIEVTGGQDYADFRFAVDPLSGYGIKQPDGSYTVIDFATMNVQSHDWQKEVFQSALTQNYNVSINTGGDSSTKLSSSFGYLNQEGILTNNTFERYNARMRTVSNVTPKLTIGTGINFSHQIESGAVTSASQNSYTGVLQMILLTNPYVISSLQTRNYDPLTLGLSNPIDYLKYSYKKIPTTRTFIDGFTQYRFTDNLILRASGNGMVTRSRNDEWYPSTTSWGYYSKGLAVLTSIDTYSWQTSNTLTYTELFNDHYVSVMAGFEFSQYGYNSMYTRAEGFLDQSHPGIYDLSQAMTYPQKNVTDRTLQSLESEFARLNYTFKDRYLLTATIRRDGSSKFGENSKYAYFPSAAIAWKIHNEHFMQNQTVVNEFKIRASLGATGNDRIPAYRALSRMEQANYPGEEPTSSDYGLAPSEIANPNLKWETTYQYDAGFDLQMFSGRITLNADFYIKRTKDMLLQTDVPSQMGSYRQWQNIGKVENKGLEVMISSVIFRNKDFSWTSNFNISANHNKVLSLGETKYIRAYIAGGHITSDVGRVIPGRPIGTGWGYIWNGIYQKSDFTDDTYTALKEGVPSFSGVGVQPGDLKFKDITGDGKITTEDKTVISRSEPKHFGGFSNNFTYKQFDLTLFLQWSYGNQILNFGRYRYEGNIPYYNVSQKYWDNHWTDTNASNRYPRLQGNGMIESSTYYVEDGSYLRLKNVVFGYNLPPEKLKKTGLAGLRVYLSADNLFTWTNYSGYDPEISYNNSLIRGVDYTSYPQAFTINFGVNAKF